MARYLVDYYETYSKSYEVVAETKEEAEEKVRRGIQEGMFVGPDACTDSWCEVVKLKDEPHYEELAKNFIEAIKEISMNSDKLDNFESYLSGHFDVWMEKFANSPEGLTSEVKNFAEMEI